MIFVGQMMEYTTPHGKYFFLIDRCRKLAESDPRKYGGTIANIGAEYIRELTVNAYDVSVEHAMSLPDPMTLPAPIFCVWPDGTQSIVDGCHRLYRMSIEATKNLDFIAVGYFVPFEDFKEAKAVLDKPPERAIHFPRSETSLEGGYDPEKHHERAMEWYKRNHPEGKK